MRNTTEAIIDLAALRANLALVRELCPRSKVMAMVKANAYGHGFLQAAEALAGSDGFAVARLLEGVELREAGFENRILVTGTWLDAADLEMCSRLNIDVTLHDMETVKCAARVSGKHPLRIWLKLDSGMHRMGLQPEEFRAASEILTGLSGIREIIHMTHLSSADEPDSPANNEQVRVFLEAHKCNQNLPVSIANSAAIISRKELRTDWVRPGIMLYGDNQVPGLANHVPLQPVMSLRAKVIAVRTLPAGESVGYAGTWICPRPSRIATIGIGYGDGYPRHAATGTPVIVNGERARLVGRVSMDSITVDVTECNPVHVGDEAILWGRELLASEVAPHAKTITNELFTSIGQRVRRVYADNAATRQQAEQQALSTNGAILTR